MNERASPRVLGKPLVVGQGEYEEYGIVIIIRAKRTAFIGHADITQCQDRLHQHCAGGNEQPRQALSDAKRYRVLRSVYRRRYRRKHS